MATTKSDQFSVNLKLSPTAKNEKPASGGKKKTAQESLASLNLNISTLFDRV